MKATTTQIYDLITSTNFESIKQKLVSKVDEHNWTIPDRQEYTYNELINDLPDYVDFIRQNIEDNSFDSLPLSTRQQIHQVINQINSHLANIYANHQQFANLQDLTQSLMIIVRTNRLDFEARRIPRYKEKIKEYKDLIEELNSLNTTLSTTKTKQDELEEVLTRAEDIISDLNIHTERAKKSEEEIGSKLENTKDVYNQIGALLETIKENKENIIEILKEAKSSNSSIEEVEGDINTFHSKIDEYETKMSKFIKDTEETITLFETNTDEIIKTNESQQEEIDNQLNKAVGASLFSTFATRKDELNENLNKWLGALAVILAVIIGLSVWIAVDIISIDTNWYKVGIKIAVSFPLIYMLVFISSRYTKERRLVEEYAFKSTISLALTPYADLIKKVEEEGTDSKYRDFLISSIENIFSAPTDKAFGFNKHSNTDKDKNNAKVVDDVLNLINKAKKVGQDI
ncbi:MAG: hypothetical protein GQ531_04955 [Sulfurovum sp.]|nr:hypothetical protein [Sulfurovum sp.]